jgi:ribosomal protein L40E
MLHPYDWLIVDTAMYIAGGGSETLVATKTQPTTQTNTTQTRTTSSSANSTSTPIASTNRNPLFYTAFVTTGVIVITAAYLYMWNRDRGIAPKTILPADKKLESHKFCINCGTQLPPDSTVCDKCGAKQT